MGYAFGQGDTIDDAKQHALADALKRSAKLTVRYDPANPSEAVLNTTALTSVKAIGYMFLVFAVFSGLIVWGGS